MLEISRALPSTAIFGAEAARLKEALVDQNTSWFQATENYVDVETNEDANPWVSEWKSSTTDIVALPTRPNQQNGHLDVTASIPAMCFRAQTHCGYSSDNIAASAERFSVAVLYRSENQDARTVFSITRKDQNNILFANENSGKLAVVDRAGTLKIERDAPALDHRYNLMVVSYAAGK